MTTPERPFDDADLNGFVDGRIDPARAAALSGALARDPEARARIDGWKRQNESLRTLFASVLFEPVPVRLVPTGIAPRPSGRPVPSGAGPERRPRSGGAIATALVGVGLVGFALGALASLGTDGFGAASRPIGRASRDPVRGLAARALEAHRTYLADGTRPVEMGAAEEPRFLHWMQNRVGAPVRIPDLRALGWSFAGGRVIPAAEGAAAFLVYNSGAERLALNVARAASGGADAAGPVDGARVMAWSDGPFDYALTTTRDGEWLARNASVLRASIDAQGGEASPP